MLQMLRQILLSFIIRSRRKLRKYILLWIFYLFLLLGSWPILNWHWILKSNIKEEFIGCLAEQNYAKKSFTNEQTSMRWFCWVEIKCDSLDVENKMISYIYIYVLEWHFCPYNNVDYLLLKIIICFKLKIQMDISRYFTGRKTTKR